MFETLYKQNAVLVRYRAAPHAASREHFLKICAERGYSKTMLHKISWVLLSVTSNIKKVESHEVTVHQIEQAVAQRKKFTRASERTDGFQCSRQMFIHITTEWFKSLGCVVTIPKVEYRFANQLNIFIRYLSEERGLSPVTVSSRHDHIADFFKRLARPRDSLHDITIADVDSFIEDKSSQGWSRASLGTLASSLRSFFSYAHSQNWCSAVLAKVIESPRIYALEGIPLGPSWQDVQRLLSNAKGDRPVNHRNLAVLMLLSIYGLRRGEVAALKLEDINWIAESVLIARPKQRCKQAYPLLAAVGNAILRYLRQARPNCSSQALFLTVAAPFRPLSASSISAIVRSHLKALDIKLPSQGAHCLRHACATHLQDSGFSLKHIGDHLGHRSPNSTLHYTKVDLKGLRQVAEIDLGSLL